MTSEKILQSKRNYYRNQRLQCLNYYSVGDTPHCEICSESLIEFLAIDHIYGHGKEHRREVGGGTKFYSWLIKNDFPDGYRVLCHNCNLKHRDNTNCARKTVCSRELSQTPNAIARRKYTSKNREKMCADAKDYRYKIKRQTIDHYGGCCACCHNDDFKCLSIDHIGAGGAEHRRIIGNGSVIYRWLRNNHYPSGFRVLCMNCNISFGSYGYCPHIHQECSIS